MPANGRWDLIRRLKDKALSQNNFRGCFEEWKSHTECCVASGGNFSEEDILCYNNFINKTPFEAAIII